MEQGYYRKNYPLAYFFLKLAPTQIKSSIDPRRKTINTEQTSRHLGIKMGTGYRPAKPSIRSKSFAIRGLGGAHGTSPHFHDARV